VVLAIRSAPEHSYCSRNAKDTRFHIHGTTDPDSIGKAVSSSCIRVVNQDVDSYSRVPLDKGRVPPSDRHLRT
jgi:lipoprotein-anchoring transpeptidase ErfK/SrfK